MCILNGFLFKIQPVNHSYCIQSLVLETHGAERVGLVVPQAPAAQVDAGPLAETSDADHDHVFVALVVFRLQRLGDLRRDELALLLAKFRFVRLLLQVLPQHGVGDVLDFV